MPTHRQPGGDEYIDSLHFEQPPPPPDGARPTVGAPLESIADRWHELGGEDGVLGRPLSEELALPDGVGRMRRFRYGFLCSHPVHGTHEVTGTILREWADSGYESGPAGYPVDAPDHFRDMWAVQEFEHQVLLGSYAMPAAFFSRGRAAPPPEPPIPTTANESHLLNEGLDLPLRTRSLLTRASSGPGGRRRSAAGGQPTSRRPKPQVVVRPEPGVASPLWAGPPLSKPGHAGLVDTASLGLSDSLIREFGQWAGLWEQQDDGFDRGQWQAIGVALTIRLQAQRPDLDVRAGFDGLAAG